MVTPLPPEGPSPTKVTPSELLDIREGEWRPRVTGASLVSEVSVAADQRSQAAIALGQVLISQLDRQLRPRLERWPACMTVATVGIATDHYSSGAFWPYLWDHVRVPERHRDNSRWGDPFLESLRQLDLDDFTLDTRQKYVGPILMHAGVPTYCLGDLFDLILQRVHATPGFDAHALHAWALGGPNRLNKLDVPARDFLSSGRDYALETIERAMHLLELLQNDPGAEPRDAGLHDRFHQPAVEALDRARVQGTLPTWDRSASMRRRAQRPGLHLDPYVHGVHVRLPLDEFGDDVRWSVVTGDESHSVLARRSWDSDGQTAFSLPRPTRSVSVAPHRSDSWQHLVLIDPDDPLLLFTENGDLIRTDLALPPGSVWVLHPSERGLEHSSRVEFVERGDTPYGWHGWELLRLHMDRSGWVGLADGPRHRAQGRSRPEVELSGQIPGVTTTLGAPVLAERPTVLLPDDTGGNVRWDSEVLTADGATLLSRASGTAGERLHPFTELASPLVGSFLVRVRGPLGRGVQRQVSLAEGLTAAHVPRVRALAPGGLVPGRSILAPAADMEVEPARHDLASDQVSGRSVVHGSGSTLPVSVAPPHLRVLTTGGHTPRWSAEPLRLDTETLLDAGDLLVRLPENEDASLVGEVCVRSGTEFAQWLAPRVDGGGLTLRYPLGQAVGTATEHGSVDLVLGYDARVVPLASVRPRTLATSARYLDGDRPMIRLEGFVGGENVRAAVYCQHAPWRDPEILIVHEEGEVALPADGGIGGPIRLLLAIDDPWSGADWPRWPTGSEPNLLDCEVPGRARGADAEEEALCRSFPTADTTSAPRLGHGNAIRLWRVLAQSARLRNSGVSAEAMEWAVRSLAEVPALALGTHPEAISDPRESVRALVASGLAAAPMADLATRGTASVADLWGRSPVAACLAGAQRLGDRSPGSPECDELEERLIHRCGPSASVLLDDRGDPYAEQGTFDQTTLRMASLSPDQWEELWQAARVVPQAMLDGDARAEAAMGLFMVRDAPELREALRHGADIFENSLNGAVRLPTPYRDRTMALLRSRNAPARGVPAWYGLPTVSLALALSARLAARGMPYFTTVSRSWHEAWSGLTHRAPDLVATDLVLSELVLCGAERAHGRKDHP